MVAFLHPNMGVKPLTAASEERASVKVAVSRLRVIVADEHPLIRIGLSEFLTRLSDQVEIVEAKSLEDALEALDQGEFNLMITDLVVQPMRGFEGLRQIHQKAPDLPVVVLSVKDSAHDVRSAIEAGAMGYLLKDQAPDDVGAAILEMLGGGSPMSPAIARYLLRRMHAERDAPRDEETHADAPRLSQRESEVLGYIVKGFTYAEIAELMDISEHTVSSHIRKIYRKLSVHSRGEAVYEALQLGIVKSDG